jgi:Zn-dependent membrane protease YugP
MLIGPFIIGGIFMLISWIVSNRLKNKFKEYSQIHLTKDLTGAEIARLMLADNGINDVKVISVEGQLTDHYNPVDKTVNLSQEVFYGRNAAATAVAAHECGHAVQHAKAYSMLQFRSAMVPVQNISGTVVNFVSMALLFGGAFLHNFWPTAILLIVVCNLVFTLFALVTLPVEFDASNRALAWVEARGIVTTKEHGMAKDALKWAAMTYVVAALAAVTSLVYWVMTYLGSRD